MGSFNENLYYKIMQDVSESIKHILDETFTTYPWDKVSKYVSKISQELSICIKPDSEQYSNPPDEWMNDTFLDDSRYIVFSLISNNISSNTDYFENIKKALQLIGLNYSKSYIQNDKEMLMFLPKKQNSINMDIFKDDNFLYHICPRYVTEKIKKIGFVPKSKNNVFEYDPRIHFFFPNTPMENMRLIRQQLDDNNKSNGNRHEYDLIKIKIPENVIFYKNIDCQFGIFTNENIKPEYIEDIKPIDGITMRQYREHQLKLMFPNL